MAHKWDRVIERRYEEVYASHYEQLQARRRTDPDFTPDDIRAFLKDAYVRQGNDWIGHGALFDATQGAIVAAHEAVLADWLNTIEQTGEGEDENP